MTEAELARVLTAAVPAATEYCFAWAHLWWPWHWWLCMTKGEWASWAQGIGTLAAVLVAVGVYVADYCATRRQAVASAKVHALALRHVLVAALAALEGYGSRIEAIVKKEDLVDLQDLLEEVDELPLPPLDLLQGVVIVDGGKVTSKLIEAYGLINSLRERLAFDAKPGRFVEDFPDLSFLGKIGPACTNGALERLKSADVKLKAFLQ
jgi:hypothetical protein